MKRKKHDLATSRAPMVSEKEYDHLLGVISDTYRQGQIEAFNAVNIHLIETYWLIGRHIVGFEQGGNVKAKYGKALLKSLSNDLSLRHGKGFSLSNVYLMRQFFLCYPKFQTSGISHSLTWSHFCELLSISDEIERQFYEVQCIKEKWSVRELKRQKETSLFLRLASSKDKDAVLKLAKDGQLVNSPRDIIRDPYVFEFLKISEPFQASEKELETRLCDHLQQFLLELGKGFSFVGRQYHITLNNEHFYVDLVLWPAPLNDTSYSQGSRITRASHPGTSS